MQMSQLYFLILDHQENLLILNYFGVRSRHNRLSFNLYFFLPYIILYSNFNYFIIILLIFQKLEAFAFCEHLLYVFECIFSLFLFFFTQNHFLFFSHHTLS